MKWTETKDFQGGLLFMAVMVLLMGFFKAWPVLSWAMRGMGMVSALAASMIIAVHFFSPE